MDAIEFVKACRRMYKKKRVTAGIMADKPEDVVAEVEKWAKENPAKTRQSEFLKIFPDAVIDTNTGAVSICPAAISKSYRDETSICNQGGINCCDCQSRFWLGEIE